MIKSLFHLDIIILLVIVSKEELINNADYYLYYVKENGKNGYYGFSIE